MTPEQIVEDTLRGIPAPAGGVGGGHSVRATNVVAALRKRYVIIHPDTVVAALEHADEGPTHAAVDELWTAATATHVHHRTHRSPTHWKVKFRDGRWVITGPALGGELYDYQIVHGTHDQANAYAHARATGHSDTYARMVIADCDCSFGDTAYCPAHGKYILR